MNQSNELRYLSIFSAVLFAGFICWTFIKKRYIYVGKVDKLFIYPIKGVQPIKVEYIEGNFIL